MTKLILKHLMSNEEYSTKVYPFLKEDYFDSSDEKYFFKVINKYHNKYSHFPNFNEVEVLIGKNPNDEDRLRLENMLGGIKKEPDLETQEFLLDETEEYIRNTDLKLQIMESVSLIQSDDNTKTAQIPSMIESSLAITFNKEIGLDFSNDIQTRLDYYKKQEESGFKCDLGIINKLTNGGFKRKSLTTIVGAPHSGKTIFQTHLASSFIANGYNVLYITLEMDEKEIAKRVDSNLMSIPINGLKDVEDFAFINSYKKLIENGLGKLVIKEFPTGSANSIHFKALLKDLKQKQKFEPDVIMVDYLGIMGQVSESMYDNIKRNAEGLRAIAIEFDCCVITASQTNRQGFDKNNGIAMSDIAESTGPLQISDCVLGISKFETGVEDNEKQDGSGMNKVHSQKILMNVIKNRFGGLTSDKFLINQNFTYMRLEEMDDDNSDEQPTAVGIDVPGFGKVSKNDKRDDLDDDNPFNF